MSYSLYCSTIALLCSVFRSRTGYSYPHCSNEPLQHYSGKRGPYLRMDTVEVAQNVSNVQQRVSVPPYVDLALNTT